MNEQILQQQQQMDGEPRPPYLDLEASIVLLEGEGQLAWDAMQTAYEACGDQTKLRIDQLQEVYAGTAAEAEERGEPLPKVASLFDADDGIPEEFKSSAIAFEDCMDRVDGLEEELELHAPEKAVEVMKKAAELEARLDYDRVVALVSDTPYYSLRHEVSLVIGARRLLVAGQVPSYQQLQLLEETFKKYDSKWQQNGVVTERAGSSSDAQQERDRSQDVNLVSEVEAYIEAGADMRAKYKDHDTEQLSQLGEIRTFAAVLATRGGDEATFDDLFGFTQIVYNDKMTAAIERALAEKLKGLSAAEFETDLQSDSYQELLESARSIDVLDALKNIEITGSFENLPFEFDAVELKLLLLSSIPPLALASVKKIEFRPLTKEEDAGDNTLGNHTYSKKLGGGIIVISDAKVKKEYQTILKLQGGANNAARVAELSSKIGMIHTIVHEFGHALHGALPVAALKRWEDQRASDPTNVTAYVKGRHDKGHLHRYMEDFSDSMALFIGQPEVLKVISPVRYDAMQQIFEDYMPSYPEVTKITQEQRITRDRVFREARGMTDDDVRAIHLSHERAA